MLKYYVKPVLIIVLIVLALIGFGTVLNVLFSTSEATKTMHGIVVQDSTKPIQSDTQQSERISHLTYSFPEKVFGSTYSIRSINLQELQSSDVYKRAGIIESGAVVNLVFFNTQMQDYRMLFDKPVYIKRYSYPIDSSDLGKTNIVYEVNIFDSNKDGVINGKDNSILFISDLTGKTLTQITPDSVSVVRYRFEEKNQSISIDTQIPPHDYKLDEFLWPRQQFWYDISTNKFKYFQFDTMLQVARKIINK